MGSGACRAGGRPGGGGARARRPPGLRASLRGRVRSLLCVLDWRWCMRFTAGLSVGGGAMGRVHGCWSRQAPTRSCGVRIVGGVTVRRTDCACGGIFSLFPLSWLVVPTSVLVAALLLTSSLFVGLIPACVALLTNRRRLKKNERKVEALRRRFADREAALLRGNPEALGGAAYGVPPVYRRRRSSPQVESSG